MTERGLKEFRCAAGREKTVLLRCLLSTFGIGLACHAAIFFSDISFYDDVVCTYDVGTTYILGRFTLAFLGKITRLPFGGSNYSLPWFNGMISLFFLAIFAWMTVRLLHITSRVAQVLVCGILVSFPVMASLFAYGFTAPYYMLALPMCGVSAYCLTLRGPFVSMEGRRGILTRLFLWAVGIAVMALMIGIYQAYLPVLLTLEVMILLRDEVEASGSGNRAAAVSAAARESGCGAEVSAAAGEICRGAAFEETERNGEEDTGFRENARKRGEGLSAHTAQDRRQMRRWRYALGGTILGFAGYLILMQLSLILTGKELYSYRGIDSLGTGGSSYLTRILWAYRIFFEPESFEELRGSSDYLLFMWSMGWIYRGILVLILVLAVLGAYHVWRGAGNEAAKDAKAGDGQTPSGREAPYVSQAAGERPKTQILSRMNTTYTAPEKDGHNMMCRTGVPGEFSDTLAGSREGTGRQYANEERRPADENQLPTDEDRRPVGRMVRYLLLTAMFPLMVDFVFVMTDFDVYSLMLFAQVFVFVYPLMMTQILTGFQAGTAPAPAAGSALREPESSACVAGSVPREREATASAAESAPQVPEAAAAPRGLHARRSHAMVTAVYLLTAVLTVYSIVFYCRYDNLCYYKAGRMQSAAIAYDEILIARILAVDGYDASLPVCFINEREKDVTGWETDEELEEVNITPYGMDIINSYSWCSFMNIHCGYSPRVIEDYHQYDNYIEENDMPSYPAEGSIRVIDGVIVVNF